jgi:DNA-directed RNA polymerase specialized sigma24 family protein
MEPNEQSQDLSDISTQWTDLHLAHGGHPDSDAARAAQRRLLQCYGLSILRYLRAALRDRDAANEVYQSFALRLVRGDFRGAAPERGKFRNYVKSALFHLVSDHYRERKRNSQPLPPDCADPACPADFSCEDEQQFVAIWRDELITAAMHALQCYQQRTGQPLYAVLNFSISHPHLRSAQKAAHFSALLQEPLDAQWYRKRLHQARVKFADLLLEEVASSLEHPTTEAIEHELIDLGLLYHCRTALERRKNGRA